MQKKNIEIDFHFMREQVENNRLLISFVSSKDRTAGAIAKPLKNTDFCGYKISLIMFHRKFAIERGRDLNRDARSVLENKTHKPYWNLW